MAIVVLDIQHAGKPSKKDLGASHDLDRDGIIEEHEHEARLTPIYAAAAKKILIAAGHFVKIETSGSYSARQKRTVKLAKDSGKAVAYVACHLNAGGGDYGLVCWDYRSDGGRMLSKMIGAELLLEFNRSELRRVYTFKDSQTAPRNRPSAAGEAHKWERLPRYHGDVLWPRPFPTISGVYKGPANLSGICFEPAFIDSHAALITSPFGLERMGRALALGLIQWLCWRSL